MDFFLEICFARFVDTVCCDEFVCSAVLPASVSAHLTTWCIDELKRYATSSLSTAAIAMMLVCSILD